jgi:hypothetical protein
MCHIPAHGHWLFSLLWCFLIELTIDCSGHQMSYHCFPSEFKMDPASCMQHAKSDVTVAGPYQAMLMKMQLDLRRRSIHCSTFQTSQVTYRDVTGKGCGLGQLKSCLDGMISDSRLRLPLSMKKKLSFHASNRNFWFQNLPRTHLMCRDMLSDNKCIPFPIFSCAKSDHGFLSLQEKSSQYNCQIFRVSLFASIEFWRQFKLCQSVISHSQLLIIISCIFTKSFWQLSESFIVSHPFRSKAPDVFPIPSVKFSDSWVLSYQRDLPQSPFIDGSRFKRSKWVNWMAIPLSSWDYPSVKVSLIPYHPAHEARLSLSASSLSRRKATLRRSLTTGVHKIAGLLLSSGRRVRAPAWSDEDGQNFYR